MMGLLEAIKERAPVFIDTMNWYERLSYTSLLFSTRYFFFVHLVL